MNELVKSFIIMMKLFPFYSIYILKDSTTNLYYIGKGKLNNVFKLK